MTKSSKFILGDLPPIAGMTMTPSARQPRGLLVPGNIDLLTRPRARNADGQPSTVKTISMGDEKGREVVLPLVQDDGRILDERNPQHIREVWDKYQRTGKHLGIFADVPGAVDYARRLHEDYENGMIPGYAKVAQ